MLHPNRRTPEPEPADESKQAPTSPPRGWSSSDLSRPVNDRVAARLAATS